MVSQGRSQGAGLVAIVLALTGFSWGFILIKLLGMAPPVIAFWRLAIGASTLIAVALAWRVPWPRAVAPTIAAGVAFGAHQLLFITATQMTSVAIVTLMGASQPLLVALVSHKTVGESVPRPLYGCAALAIAGTGLVVYANQSDPSRSLAGDLLAAVNVVAFTAYFLCAKRARQHGAHTLTFTASFLAIALAVVTPALAFTALEVPDNRQWGLLAVLALGSGNGHLLVNWAHPRVSAALASLMLASIPILSSLWAHLVLGEPYTWLHIAGMALVLAAIELGRRVEARAARP